MLEHFGIVKNFETSRECRSVGSTSGTTQRKSKKRQKRCYRLTSFPGEIHLLPESRSLPYDRFFFFFFVFDIFPRYGIRW